MQAVNCCTYPLIPQTSTCIEQCWSWLKSRIRKQLDRFNCLRSGDRRCIALFVRRRLDGCYTVEKCHRLLEQAGFEDIDVKIDQDGSYISLEKAKAMWPGSSHPAPGQYPPPLSTLSTEQLAQAKAQFEAELEALQTEQGIWNDITTFYVFGQK